MEREDAFRMVHACTGEMIQLTPTADYYCENCGSEYEWRRGTKHLIRSFDSRTQEYDPRSIPTIR